MHAVSLFHSTPRLFLPLPRTPQGKKEIHFQMDQCEDMSGIQSYNNLKWAFKVILLMLLDLKKKKGYILVSIHGSCSWALPRNPEVNYHFK